MGSNFNYYLQTDKLSSWYFKKEERTKKEEK